MVRKLLCLGMVLALASALALPVAAAVVFQDGFESPVVDPVTHAPRNSPNWVLGGFQSRAKLVDALSPPIAGTTITPVIMDGAQVLRAGLQYNGGQHDYNLTNQYEFYQEAWLYTLTPDQSGASSGLNGMALTLNVGGATYGANWIAIGNTGTQRGAQLLTFHYKARYGVNWGGGQNNWLDTNLAIPDNKWVKFAMGYRNLDPSKTAGEYTLVWMSISWDNQVMWSRYATMDNGIIGSTVVNAQIGNAPGVTSYAVLHADNYLATDTLPEPASLAALLSGLACSGLLRIRRRS